MFRKESTISHKLEAKVHLSHLHCAVKRSSIPLWLGPRSPTAGQAERLVQSSVDACSADAGRAMCLKATGPTID